ncbi:unnamed protein product [marine sediment metagenome]|uniref:Uncharacterized protein n=1 Tax=marine sediment metagenome TaxID=412755 RepID=X0YMT6_9ZZZZ
MISAGSIAGGKDTQYLGAHSAVAEETAPVLDGFPDQAANVDFVDTTEDHVADLHAPAKSLIDFMYL